MAKWQHTTPMWTGEFWGAKEAVVLQHVQITVVYCHLNIYKYLLRGQILGYCLKAGGATIALSYDGMPSYAKVKVIYSDFLSWIID